MVTSNSEIEQSSSMLKLDDVGVLRSRSHSESSIPRKILGSTKLVAVAEELAKDAQDSKWCVQPVFVDTFI